MRSTEFHMSIHHLAKYQFTDWQYTVKTYVKRPLSIRPQIGFQDQLSLNAGQNTFIKLPLNEGKL